MDWQYGTTFFGVLFLFGGIIYKTFTKDEHLGVSDCYGWRCYDPGTLPSFVSAREGITDFCDLPIFDGENVPPELHGNISWAQQPFVLRGVKSLLARQQDLTRHALLEAAVQWNLSTSVGHSWTIVSHRGEGPRRILLRDYLESVMYESWYDEETQLEPAYVFDRHWKLSGLPGEVPSVISSWNTSAFQLPDTASQLVMLGGAGSAVGWHQHGAAVQMTLHGLKRWFLFPAGRYPLGSGPGSGDGLTDWLRVVYPTLRHDQKPLECIQHFGDVLFVPDGWFHAVVNLADTFAVSIQSVDYIKETEKRFSGFSLQYIDHLRKDDVQTLNRIREDVEEHIKRHPQADMHARRILFYILLDSKQEEALQLMLDGIKKDPFHMPMYFEVAKWLEARATAGDPVALQMFKDVMPSWMPYLESKVRNLKALWILSKYYKLIGDTEKWTQYHTRLKILHERGIDR